MRHEWGGRMKFNLLLKVFDLVIALTTTHPLVSAQYFAAGCLEHSNWTPAIVYFYNARRVALRCMHSAVLQFNAIIAVGSSLSGTSSAAYATVKRFLEFPAKTIPNHLMCLHRINFNPQSCDWAVFRPAEANINESFSFPFCLWTWQKKLLIIFLAIDTKMATFTTPIPSFNMSPLEIPRWILPLIVHPSFRVPTVPFLLDFTGINK